MAERNKTLDPRGRFDAVMAARASSLFTAQ